MYMPFLEGTIWSQLYKLQFVPVLDTEGEQCLKHPFPTYWCVGIEVYCGRLNGHNPQQT